MNAGSRFLRLFACRTSPNRRMTIGSTKVLADPPPPFWTF